MRSLLKNQGAADTQTGCNPASWLTHTVVWSWRVQTIRFNESKIQYLEEELNSKSKVSVFLTMRPAL
jgi:hypothetical protein